VNKGEIARFERVVRTTLGELEQPTSSWMLVCGSVPPGVPSGFYAKLIGMARERKVNTLLHADGEVLREGVEARPTVVTPNQQEAERLLGRNLLTRTHYLEAAAAGAWPPSPMACTKPLRRVSMRSVRSAPVTHSAPRTRGL
jgi:fructose-1-phosphate kinase PfkB-like protein